MRDKAWEIREREWKTENESQSTGDRKREDIKLKIRNGRWRMQETEW